MKKARKRRTQTLAEKSPAGTKLYPWGSTFDVYFKFEPSADVCATITKIDQKWLMAVRIVAQKYSGERLTLDAAFHAVNDLLYKHAREFWLRMDGRAVTACLEDFLKSEI